MTSTFKKLKFTEKWRDGLISNHFYMMMVNFWSSRSYNDLSQYPVIPWFLEFDSFKNTESNPSAILPRNFEKNLITLGSEKRLEYSMIRYEEGSDVEADRYFIGSHYSNPGVILQYLVRVPPFLDGLIKFQSGKLDCADRMFSNIMQSYELALTENGDVRELISESIVLPEMYRNNLKVNFGVTQENIRVDAIKLPNWANQDPYYFTCMMKELFENKNTSDGIHKWIDLIFGFKQRGEAAIDSINLYPSITYEDGVDMDNPDNQAIKGSLVVQAYNYGQCPTQIFNEPHIKKDIPRAPLAFLDKTSDLHPRGYDLGNSKFGKITEAKFINDTEFIMYSQKQILFGMEYTSYTEGSKKEIISERSNFKKQKISFDENKIYFTEDAPIKIMVKNGIRILVGGYWDGRLVMQNVTKKGQDSTFKKHLYRITMIEVSESENIIITGSEKGDIVKWITEDDELKCDKPFFHHQNTVTGACIHEDMGVFATCSKDETVNLYTISPPYILRSFKHPESGPLGEVLISETPLASIIMGKLSWK